VSTCSFTAAAAAVLRPELEWRLRFIVAEASSLARRRVGGSRAGVVTAADLALAYNIWLRAGPVLFKHRGSGAAAAASVALREEPIAAAGACAPRAQQGAASASRAVPRARRPPRAPRPHRLAQTRC
jgi:hypothetical protein